MVNLNQPLVETKSGKIEGLFRQGVLVFKGIPYASPPTGENRWLPPQPLNPWADTRSAHEFGPVAPQNAGKFSEFRDFTVSESQSEGCLFLNIWTSGLDSSRRPVMVWFHGGAFTMGSGSSPQFDGANLAARGDCVVVTLNYRLGLLGFLNLNEVTGGQIPATGNEGLLDQIAALGWIQTNISSFGGDPGNITLFGESAGAMSIGCLLAMPKARGLFHKTILQSGAANRAKSMDKAVEHAQMVLRTLGLKAGDASHLRALGIDQILAAQQTFETLTPALTLATPVIDGEVIPELPLNAVMSGSASKVPMLIGTNQDEWQLFSQRNRVLQKMTEATLHKLCQRLIPSRPIDGLIEAYRNARNKRGAASTPLELFLAIKTDFEFRIPALLLAEAQSNNNQPVYNYLFDWKSPARGGTMGACHALEVGFVFGTYDGAFCGSGPHVQNLSLKIQDAWIAFARTGNPSCKSLGSWPLYCPHLKTMILGERTQVVEAPFDEERRAWDAFPEAFTAR